VGANVIGVALNRVDLDTRGYYSYNSDGLPGGISSNGNLLEAGAQSTSQRQN
jgi:hypothetical protein